MDRPLVWVLTGRSRQLARTVAAVRDGGGVVLIGPAGVGKTRLAREALVRARVGRDVHWVVGTASARGIPLGAFAPLIGRLRGPVDADVLGRAVEALRREGRVVVVDDAHLLDDLSATLVHQLAAQRGVGLVVTVRQGEPAPDAVVALWKNGLAQRQDVEPLDRESVGELLTAVLGHPVDRLSLERLCTATRGNLLWLRLLVEGELAAGRLTEVGGLWRWEGEPEFSPALTDLVDAQLGPLSGPARELLELVALGEPLGLGMLLGLVDADCVEDAAESGVITVARSGRRRQVSMGHPLFGDRIRSRMSALRARRRCGQLADALAAAGSGRADDALRWALLTLDGDQAPDPALLTEAAHQAALLTDLALSERLLRAAVAAGGGFPTRLALGFLLMWTFRADEGAVELARAVEQAADVEQLAAAVAARAYCLYFGDRPDDAVAVLDTVPDGPGQARMDAPRALFAFVRERLAEAAEAAERVLADPDSPPVAVTVAGWAAIGAAGRAGRGDRLAELAGRVLPAAAAAADTALLRFNITYWHGCGLALAGELTAAEEAGAWLRESSTPLALAWQELLGGRVALDRGQVRLAARLVSGLRPYFPGHGYGWTELLESIIAQALGAAGDAFGARDALARAAAGRHTGVSLARTDLLLAQAWLAAAEGSTDRAAQAAAQAAEHAARTGQWAVEADARHAAVRFGDASHAARLTELAGRVHGPRSDAAAAHAAALAARDPAALLACADRLAQLELWLAAADAAAQAAVLHRARGRTGQAALAAARADTLVRTCGGARTPALAEAVMPQLSAREREVATLVALGLTNRQIATRMHLAVRTVESHIYRACTRLGLSDRVGLAALAAPPLADAGPAEQPRQRAARSFEECSSALRKTGPRPVAHPVDRAATVTPGAAPEQR